jgi:hypothetical protein
VNNFDLTADEYEELLGLFDQPDGPTAHTAAGRRRRRCKRTPAHPHCRSVKWSAVYEALRRKGKSKKNAAQIANSMHNKWLMGRIKRKTWP